MKIQELSLAAAKIAEERGWAAATSLAIANKVKRHPVNVARSAPIRDITARAEVIVMNNSDTYPRAAIELQIGALDHPQRLRLLHALEREGWE